MNLLFSYLITTVEVRLMRSPGELLSSSTKPRAENSATEEDCLEHSSSTKNSVASFNFGVPKDS